MKRLFTCIIALAGLALGAPAQEKNPVIEAAKRALQRQSENLVAALEEMPADKYGFKPTPQQEPFAHIAIHTSQANYLLCSKVGNVAAPTVAELKEDAPKDQLVTALRASFDFCGKALAQASDANLGDEVELFGGRKGTRASAVLALAGGWADHYAQAAMYLRLSGLLPPTAKPKK
ncbi:MAG TPA: DinB family protein [Terriglobales bacterium]|nr:DinB family protein [Terriglobales bacterium]